MSEIYDFAIIGGGLAGSTAAACLAEGNRVTLIDLDDSTFVGSSAPAGLYNPIMTRQGTRIWNASSVLASFHKLVSLCGAEAQVRSDGILRPAIVRRQAASFIQSAKDNADICDWIPAAECADRYPDIVAPLGSLLVRGGGSVQIPAYVHHLRQYAESMGVTPISSRVIDLDRSSTEFVSVRLDGQSAERVRARKVILSMGRGYEGVSLTSTAGLHSIKGQTVVLERPAALQGLPALLGTGYLVDLGDRLVAGSSYAHEYESENPELSVSEEVRDKVSRMVPAIREATIVQQVAGVRVSVQESYLPMVGPLDYDRRRIWMINGLGSKGLLMSAWIACHLEKMMRDELPVPSEFQVQHSF